ncbi:MAG: EAL domain-containing protein [Rhodobiaceae bacterium]|nr:EAL domain-containing protein [Rhodobiaceae bacterium]
MSVICEAAYVWDVGTDDLTWLGDAAAVLKVDPRSIASNAAFSGFLDPDNLVSRYDTIVRSGETDRGDGVCYQIQYGFRPEGASGRTIWVEDTGRWYASSDGRPVRAVGVVRAINERHEREQRLAYLSRFDELTGQFNRTHLVEVAETVLANAKRYRTSGAFMIAAIDNLGIYNDRFGFDVADQVIAGVAKRLKADMRSGDVIGRYSGNKLGIILNSCTDEEMEIAARRLRAVVRNAAIETAAGPVSISISMGGVAYPRYASSVHDMMIRAQEALDKAKATGTDSYMPYRPCKERETQRQQNLKLAETIIQTLDSDQFAFALQPVIDSRTMKPAFQECLLRLDRGDGHLASAGHLIPAAERLGMMHLIDTHVLKLAIATLKARPDLVLSVNVSVGASADSGWIASLLSQTQGAPDLARRLIVEITESSAIENIEATRRFVERVHGIGARVAIDDFGAGYTSFRNLRQLDVDMVKIDGSYVSGCHESPHDLAFVRALVDLARSLGVEAVAEWVEDEDDLAVLRELGVDYLQGFILGKPTEVAQPVQISGEATVRLAG